MNSDNERQLRFFHYANENRELNIIQEQIRILEQISPWKNQSKWEHLRIPHS